jgi:hypothetical protein
VVVNDLTVLEELQGLDYPLSKQDLIAEAEAREASQHFLDSLQAVDQERFPDHRAVAAALQAGPRL